MSVRRVNCCVRSARRLLRLAALAAAGWFTLPSQAGLATLYVSEQNAVGEYTNSGVLIQDPLISNQDFPSYLVSSGGNVFVENGFGPGSISEYTTSGTLVKANIVTGITGGATPFVVSGDDIFVATLFGGGNVSEYTTAGMP